MGLTDYPNGVTSFGMPMVGGGMPMKRHAAKYYFVDGLIGRDGADGLSPANSFATIAKAITVVNARIDWAASPWATSDVIVVAPGVYAENLTSLPYGATIIGLGDAFDGDGEKGVQINPVAGSPVDVSTFINSKIQNVAFESADTDPVFDAETLNNVQLIHCVFKGAPDATTSTAGIITFDSVNLTVRDCLIQFVDCGIDFVYSDANDSFNRGLIQNNVITYCSEAGIRVGVNLVSVSSHIDGNLIDGGSGTLTIGIDLNIATPKTFVSRNIISADTGIQGATTGTYVGGNYVNGALE